jgi:outer membrane protein TolC
MLGAVPLDSLGKLELVPSKGAIPHRNGERVNLVHGFITAGAYPDTVLARVERELDDDPLDLPAGYRMETGGDAEERAEAIADLRANALPLLVLMLATVVLTFLSFRLAGLVFVAGAQSVGLGLLSLSIFGYPMGFQAIIGHLGLVGVAINAAIIISSTLQANAEAVAGDRDVIRHLVVKDTSRHIVSTTITTFGGFLPLMLSEGGFWPPFATAIAGGVLLSSVISFYFVPAAFLLLTRRRPVASVGSARGEDPAHPAPHGMDRAVGAGAVALVASLVLPGAADAQAPADAQPRDARAPAGDGLPDGGAVETLDLDAVLMGPGRAWSLTEVAQRAVEVSPGVGAAEAARSAAEATTRGRRVDLGPRVVVGARYTRLSGIDNDPLVSSSIAPPEGASDLVAGVDDPQARSLWQQQLATQDGLSELAIEIPRNQYGAYAELRYPVKAVLAEVLPALEASERREQARALEVEVAALDAALVATEAYLSHERARGALAVAEVSVGRARYDLERAEAERDAGMATRPAVLRFRARLAEARRERAERAASVHASADALRALLDLPGRGPVATAERLTRPLPQAKRGTSAEPAELVERAYERRAELRALDALLDAQRSALKARRGGAYPDLNLAARFDYARPNSLYVPPPEDFRRSWSLSAMLEWSPDGTARALHSASGAQAMLRGLEERREALRDAVRIEVSRAHARFRAAFRVLAAALEQREAAAEGYAATRHSRAEGRAAANALIEAQLDLSRAELAVLDASVALRLRHTRLRRALGAPWW